MKDKMKESLGYTLIEMITVIAIFVIIGSLITGILYSALRGGSKVGIVSTVAQSGNYALSIISNLITSSVSVLSVGGVPITDCIGNPTGTSIEISGLDGGKTTLSCINETVSSNSASLLDTSLVKITSSSCTFSCVQADPYSPPIINVGFTLENKTGSLFEKRASAPFKTSAIIRNYIQR